MKKSGRTYYWTSQYLTIYAKRKVDVEPVFGRMKGVFGVRRVHVRG